MVGGLTKKKGSVEGAVAAGSGPAEFKTTQGGATKFLPSCSAHHPEFSLEGPSCKPLGYLQLWGPCRLNHSGPYPELLEDTSAFLTPTILKGEGVLDFLPVV